MLPFMGSQESDTTQLLNWTELNIYCRLPRWQWENNLPAKAGDASLIPGPGASLGEGNDYPLQYSCLENSMDRETWWAIQSTGLQRVRHS